MRRLAVAVALLSIAGSLVPAASADARRFRGHEVFANPHQKVAVSNARGRYLTRRALNHRFLVARGTERYSCVAARFGESRCTFAFAGDESNRDYCGRAVVRATRRSVIVRYRGKDRGCGKGVPAPRPEGPIGFGYGRVRVR